MFFRAARVCFIEGMGHSIQSTHLFDAISTPPETARFMLGGKGYNATTFFLSRSSEIFSLETEYAN